MATVGPLLDITPLHATIRSADNTHTCRSQAFEYKETPSSVKRCFANQRFNF